MPSTLIHPRAAGLPLDAIFFVVMASVAAGTSAPKVTEALASNGFDMIPIRRTADHHWYRSGKLDGRRASFLVDTGWSKTTVCRNAETVAKLWEFNLGRTIFTNQSAELESVIMGGQPAPFDVVLGLDFLRRYSAVVDCAANRLYTRPARLTEHATQTLAEALRQTGRVAIDLRCRDDLVLTGAASLGGNSLELLVDTGAAWSCLDARQADAWGLQPLPSATRLAGEGRTGTRGLAVAEVKSLRLGAVEISRANWGLVSLADWGLAQARKAHGEIKGLLGGELLAAHEAIIDCGALKLWLKPRPGK